MKTYRPTRELQAKIDAALSRRPTPSAQPLDEVAEILSAGRHYAWVGIYLIAGERSGASQRAAASAAATKDRSVIAIRLGQHEFGAIEVEAESGKTLAAEDRVLLKRVAATLARFLHGPGACLVRKAREAAAEPAPTQARHQPASEKPQERSLAAAGEGRR